MTSALKPRALRRRAAFLGLAACTGLLLAGCAHHPVAWYQGYVEGRFVYVASPQSGQLEHLSVERGETISAGHPLFALDDQPEAAAAHQAEQLLRASESRLSDLNAGKRPQEIAVTQAQLLQAVAQREEADRILASDQQQVRAGGIAQTELITAQAAASTSAAKVQELEADLAVDALPARDQQIRAQRNQVAADRASLADAEWRLAQKTMVSPRQGLVFDTLYRRGEWVAAGNPVVELLPPENLEVRFFVPEPIVGKLRVGQSVRIHCDGCAAQVPANITFISPQCEYTPPVIYSNENRSKLVFMIVARPPVPQAAALHPGQPVEVTLP
ncbi:MAG TPA: HlyD family efflux transporter periplasmic adaptor subunit [Terracidiphilus sp.]|nr:HlyD family efflux transporter periplasmic adaptor subunit [Terracidiphilus sp.]